MALEERASLPAAAVAMLGEVEAARVLPCARQLANIRRKVRIRKEREM